MRRYYPPLRMAAMAVSVSLATTSCSTVEHYSRSNSNTVNCVAGSVLGALAGVAIVAASGKSNTENLIAGAVVGGASGCGLALYYKQRLTRLEQLAKEENMSLQVETLQTQEGSGGSSEEAGVVAQVQDQGMFPIGSATLSAEGQRQVRKLASAFAGAPGENNTTAILVVGHTDATGSAATNQALSERRARAVASILTEQGVAKERMYFQGAGASRPIADNSDPILRAKNRRVEIVEVNDRDTLVKRINSEANNPKYLSYGTATESAAKASSTQRKKTTGITAQTPSPSVKQPDAVNRALVDFGGSPAESVQWTLNQSMKPRKSDFTIISSAHASEVPMQSCQADSPRVSGEVKSFATGDSLNAHATREYLPGMNGRAWAGLVNGHLVTLSPVAVLRDNATLVQNPKVYITRNYASNKGKSNYTLTTTANTYEGEDTILYRVFIDQPNDSPLSCIDVVLRKAGDKGLAGNLIYNNGKLPYIANYAPVRN